jgi:hypothetical protein
VKITIEIREMLRVASQFEPRRCSGSEQQIVKQPLGRWRDRDPYSNGGSAGAGRRASIGCGTAWSDAMVERRALALISPQVVEGLQPLSLCKKNRLEIVAKSG